MTYRTLRSLLDSIEKHAEGPEELRGRGRWTPEQSMEAIVVMAQEARALLEKDRLAPGSKWALILDPKPRKRKALAPEVAP